MNNNQDTIGQYILLLKASVICWFAFYYFALLVWKVDYLNITFKLAENFGIYSDY